MLNNFDRDMLIFFALRINIEMKKKKIILSQDFPQDPNQLFETNVRSVTGQH